MSDTLTDDGKILLPGSGADAATSPADEIIDLSDEELDALCDAAIAQLREDDASAEQYARRERVRPSTAD